ncbi:hypothetical protein [Salinibaculum rarum]|uniref:hypothetical protein n=1 Tax=Salinibaculum rarum TaxID=3058903 RepID=UPI0026603764|nr:hypothetical protein [Salinibaculum sp. KK48]
MSETPLDEYHDTRDQFLTDHLIEPYINDHTVPDVTDIQTDVPTALTQHWDDYFATYDATTLARLADTPEFNPHQELTLDQAAGNIIHEIAYNTVRIDAEQRLSDLTEDIEDVIIIYGVLDEMTAVSDMPTTNPSTVVNKFFTWIGDNSDNLNSSITALGLDDFNEMHVRQLTVLNPIHDGIIIDALWEWLQDEYPGDITEQDAH